MLLDFQLNRDVSGTHAGKQTLCQVSGVNRCPTCIYSSIFYLIFVFFTISENINSRFDQLSSQYVRKCNCNFKWSPMQLSPLSLSSLREKKVKELCQSQKKVYDSYQDELADYIQVQKARGLEPKAGPATGGQTSKSLNENIIESPQPEEMMPHPALMPQRPPPAAFPQPHWHPQIPYQVNHFGFRMRGPVPHYPPEYVCHPCPPPGKLSKRRRSPDSHSSSSSSYTSSSSTTSSSESDSSSDSSSSYERRRKRRRQRKMRMQRKWRHQEEEGDVDTRGREEEKQGECKRKRKGEREEDRKARRRRERSSSGDEQSRRKRRHSKKSRRHGDHAKRRKEEGLAMRGEEAVTNEEALGEMNEYADERTDMKDGKQKHKKDKKVKEKINQEDNRTEEERLWDETILGVF